MVGFCTSARIGLHMSFVYGREDRTERISPCAVLDLWNMRTKIVSRKRRSGSNRTLCLFCISGWVFDRHGSNGTAPAHQHNIGKFEKPDFGSRVSGGLGVWSVCFLFFQDGDSYWLVLWLFGVTGCVYTMGCARPPTPTGANRELFLKAK